MTDPSAISAVLGYVAVFGGLFAIVWLLWHEEWDDQ